MCAAQYLPGTASLIEEIDKKLMVLLRDGRQGDFSTLTGLVEWILHCFHLTILLEKKNSACCLQNISVGNVRSMGHLAP